MDLGSRRSTIRELFEYGNSRAAIVGRRTYSISRSAIERTRPEAVRQAIYAEAAGDPVALHGYTSAQGAADVQAHWRTASTSVSARTTPATACT